MAQTRTQIATTDVQKSGGKKGLRTALRKWKDSLTKDKTPSRTPAPSHISATATATSPTSPLPEGVALFEPTTQTYIHSPLDKRNKASNSSSPASTLRRSYLGPRRNTAPADYFSFVSNGEATMEERKRIEHGHARRTSRLMFSFPKRASIQPQPAPSSNTTIAAQPTDQPLVSPTPSEPSPMGHENQRQTFQYTTAAEIAALTKIYERDLGDSVEVNKRDRSMQSVEPSVEGTGEVEGQTADEGEGAKASQRGDVQDGKCELEERGAV